MKIEILAVGKLRETFWKDAAAEYIKRLSRYAKLTVAEVPDQNDADPERALRLEGAALLAQIRPEDEVVALCIEGKPTDSPGLAAFLRQREMADRRLVFVIGGSQGLHPDVVARADRKLSMSAMTFPHQLARVMLLEQLYRAHKINAGEKYHK